MKTNTIIFDVGNVLYLVYDEHIKQDIAKTLGISKQQVEEAWKKYAPLLVKGEIDEDELWKRFFKTTQIEVSLPEQSLLSRELIKRYSPNEEVLKIIRSLKQSRYKLGVLSNTIKAHVDYPKQQGLFTPFDVTIFSNEVGLQKPDPEIYKMVLEKLDSKPNESVFIDDFEEYVEAARMLGMKGIVFENSEQLAKELYDMDIKFRSTNTLKKQE